ncbi:uncharacterized protein LOC134243620 [Saccostrea cucullata]|uniref:uncharacterized protein LOC134243620 n=1 Tax=Saccostrea cuccullata TaxID=36930 RepID=UPI002ED4496B
MTHESSQFSMENLQFNANKMSKNSQGCDFHKFSQIPCDETEEYLRVVDCDRSTERHLACLKSSECVKGKPFQSYDCPESLLILYRSGIFTIDKNSLNLSICEAHRAHFGLNWRRGRVRCTYPDHDHSSSKAKSDRGATPSLCKELWLKTRQIIPVGLEICKQCSTQHRRNISSQPNITFEEELEKFAQLRSCLKIEPEQLSCTESDDEQEKYHLDPRSLEKTVPPGDSILCKFMPNKVNSHTQLEHRRSAKHINIEGPQSTSTSWWILFKIRSMP